MEQKYFRFVVLIFSIFLFFGIIGCKKNKSIDKLSPKEVVDLYYKAKDKGNKDLLRQIIYFPPNISESQRKERLALTGAGEKGMMRAVVAKIKAECEKIIDDQTAEVGVVIKAGVSGFKKRIPFQQVILKKDNGIWKFSHSKHDLTEDQLIAAITKNPYDASAIFHLGRRYQPENPARASSYYRKYHELEPNGFWISEELVDQLKRFKSIEEQEREVSADLEYLPADACSRSTGYRKLGQLYIEHGDFAKARMYLDKSADALENSTDPNSPIHRTRLESAQKAFELAVKKGVGSDILKELEAKGVYK